MINYRVSYQFPHRHFIDFEMRTGPCSDQSLLVQLPSWRPGRYELGDFAKNIRAFVVTDEQGRELKFKKRTKDLWEVLGCQGKSVHISYSFYANELNAGSSYLDDEQIYMNPVNCFLYLPDYPELPYQVELDLPDTYEVATGMENEGHQLKAKDFQQLFDCPIMASSNLQHREYKYEDCLYHIWIQGEHQLDMKRFVDDHLAFTKSQVEAFGDIPCQEYHFMYQFPSRPARHGVEHCNSTVIAMGPGNALHLGKQYEELIGISCHESDCYVIIQSAKKQGKTT